MIWWSCSDNKWGFVLAYLLKHDPNLLSEHDHQIILDKIEARGNSSHDEYVEYESYYNVDIDDSNDDDN